MTVSNTLRFLLKKYSSGGDPHPSRVEFNLMIDAIENNAAMFAPAGPRPAAGKVGRWYWDATAGRMYYDDGTAWQDLNPNGGGGVGAPVVPGAAAVEGVSAKSARADHTHTIALATGAVDGAMPKADKAKLDAATDAATASAVMRRDSSGRVSVGTPTLAGHATTKAYVDGQITAIGDAAADYADGAVSAAPTATTAAAGKMSAADKAKLDAATANATDNTLMYRGIGGNVYIGTASQAGHAANKGYVDTAVTGAKTYADGAVSAAPAATTAAAGKMSAADKAKLDAATASPTVNTLALRNSAGRVQVADPGTDATAATPKSYVDTAASGAKTYADSAVDAAPAATGTTAGKMSAADKAKLDAANSTVVNNALVKRSSAGYVDVSTPTLGQHAANKTYVDDQVATRAATSHTHDAGDITTGTVAPARLPAATTLAAGALSAADKAKLDGATAAATGLTLALRYSDGRLGVTAPQNQGDAASKGYVDSQVTTRALTDHNHDATDITTGTLAPARLPLATPTAAGALRGSDQALLNTATASPTGFALAVRYADGRLGVATPTGGTDAATKAYVDAQIAALRTELS